MNANEGFWWNTYVGRSSWGEGNQEPGNWQEQQTRQAWENSIGEAFEEEKLAEPSAIRDDSQYEARASVPDEEVSTENSIQPTGYTTHSGGPRHASMLQNPGVLVSIWDPNEKAWVRMNSLNGSIKLLISKKVVRLESIYRLRGEANKELLKKNRTCVLLSSLDWELTRNDSKRAAYWEKRNPENARIRDWTVERFKPTFYFEVQNEGRLRRLQEDATPEDAVNDTLKSLKYLYLVQQKLKETLASIPPASTWIRLECTGKRSHQDTILTTLLGPKSRFEIVPKSHLPLRGAFPFLSGGGSPDGGPGNELVRDTVPETESPDRDNLTADWANESLEPASTQSTAIPASSTQQSPQLSKLAPQSTEAIPLPPTSSLHSPRPTERSPQPLQISTLPRSSPPIPLTLPSWPASPSPSTKESSRPQLSPSPRLARTSPKPIQSPTQPVQLSPQRIHGSAGGQSSGDARLRSSPTSSGWDLDDEEKSLLYQLEDIERELELLREKRAITKRLQAVRARKKLFTEHPSLL
ncbi:hypothetical protein ABW19_dt0205114 [Dactylella cylindrospora]|nr:hypothetical protein ABW19_dt0205114 [Dactylella cylindrospora]